MTHERFDLFQVEAPTFDMATAFRAAHSGDGAPWLLAAQADELARYALKRGEGICLMEAAVRRSKAPPRDVDWEILGNDRDGFNWEDHRDPMLAYRVFLAKLKKARLDKVQLLYKLWLQKGTARIE
ncbi:hypothetical protein [Sagittula sp. SSi028]|uniref:hypothetical protein n=1 Tax=Sagittula sp. SSi028 TaxID=3400636 RepID=UPI003AF515ED